MADPGSMQKPPATAKVEVRSTRELLGAATGRNAEARTGDRLHAILDVHSCTCAHSKCPTCKCAHMCTRAIGDTPRAAPGGIPLAPHPLHATPLHSNPSSNSNSTPRARPLHSTPLHSTPLHSTPHVHSTPRALPLHSACMYMYVSLDMFYRSCHALVFQSISVWCSRVAHGMFLMEMATSRTDTFEICHFGSL